MSNILSGAGECLASGMGARDAALLVDAADVAALAPVTRAAVERALAAERPAEEMPAALAAAVGPRCEAWVRSLGDAKAQGEALSLIADELFRPRRVSAVFALIVADLVVLTIVGFVFSLFVAPVWRELLEGFNADIPLPTRIAIVLGQLISVAATLVAIVLVATRVTTRIRPSSAVAEFVDRTVRRLPVASTYLRLRQSVALARWLAVGGSDAQVAASAMAEAGSAMSLGPAGRQLERQLGRGARLSEAMQRTGFFQPGLAEIVRRLEERDDRAGWSTLLAQYAEATSGREGPALDRLLLAAHFVTAVVIGIFVFGLYLPIFKMGSVI